MYLCIKRSYIPSAKLSSVWTHSLPDVLHYAVSSLIPLGQVLGISFFLCYVQTLLRYNFRRPRAYATPCANVSGVHFTITVQILARSSANFYRRAATSESGQFDSLLSQKNKWTSVFHASELLLTMNSATTLSK